MEMILFGNAIARVIGFAFAIIIVPSKLVVLQARIALIVALLLGSVSQVDQSILLQLLSIESSAELIGFLPGMSGGIYNLAVGLALGIAVSVSIAAAFVAAKWIYEILLQRFSKDSLNDFRKIEDNGIILPLFFASSLLISDLFFYLFSAFNKSFHSLPLIIDNHDFSLLSAALLKSTLSSVSEMIYLGFISSLLVFFASMIVVMSLLVGVRYVGDLAIRVTDSGVSFIFTILILSLTLYTSLTFLDKGQRRLDRQLNENRGIFSESLGISVK